MITEQDVARKDDHRNTLAFQCRQQRSEFFGVAGIGDGQHHVLLGNHANITVTGLSGVHGHGRRAGAGQG